MSDSAETGIERHWREEDEAKQAELGRQMANTTPEQRSRMQGMMANCQSSPLWADCGYRPFSIFGRGFGF